MPRWATWANEGVQGDEARPWGEQSIGARTAHPHRIASNTTARTNKPPPYTRISDEATGALGEHLLARVERTTDNTLAPGSKQSYIGSIMRYLSWLYTTGETLLSKQLLSPEFRSGVFGDEPTKTYMRALLSKKPRVPPLLFSGSDFALWFASLQKDVVRAERGHLVRENLAAPLPKVSLMTAWQLWFVEPPPLRFASPHEMRSSDDRKRLSDLAFVMKQINGRVPGFPSDLRPTLHEANDAFLEAIKHFEHFEVSPC